MPTFAIEPFSDDHLTAAGKLLGARHARHRQAEPLLPATYEEAAAARAEVEALWRTDGASGAVALRDGEAVGFIVGIPKDEDVWGPNIWVDPAGHAVEEPEDVRDLYAFAAARWVDEGRARHYAIVPASEAPLVEAWFRLSFGQQQAYGYQEVRQPAAAPLPGGFEIRKPVESEIDELLELDLALPRHQQASPVFSPRSLPTEEEIRREWIDTLTHGEEEVLIGYRDGRPVACWSYVAAEVSRHFGGLTLPEHACYLAFAVTLPPARGAGIGVALTEAGFSWAAEQGYRAMVTDWRVTNLLASRFWPRRGFRETFLRLYRSIP
jgi:ribosomal protein S18 acetylase RimI-like enzyme